MKFTVLTLFPDMFQGPMTESIIKRAREARLVEIDIRNIRDYATDKHRVTDDTPFGGGGGMVMKPEPLTAAIEDVEAGARVILMSPQGRRFDQRIAQELAGQGHLALVCGRYEGVDERVRELVIDEEISIGDYVLTGGELPAMILIDAITRLLPGVLGAPDGAAQDSHATGLLEHPHYTRPAVFRDKAVPDVLLQGHHAEIEKWRRRESLRRTWQRRPDMLATAELSEKERWFLAELAEETIKQGRE